MFLIRGSALDQRRGWTRRDCLKVSLAGGLGLSPRGIAAGPANRGFGRAQSCILIYLFGGPSHLDIWDMKPFAPEGIRGEFRPIATRVPGIQITEHLPRLARMMDRLAIVRSMAHGDSNHGSSGHAMLTGRLPRVLGEVGPSADDFPHFGSVLARLRPTRQAIAPFVSLPWNLSTSTNIVPGQTASFLGRPLDPFRLETVGEDRLNFAPPLTMLPEEVSQARLRGRQELLEQLQTADPLSGLAAGADLAGLYRRAFQFLDSPEVARAFRLDLEPDRVRGRYGWHVFGQSLLLARRLVEAGVRLVTVYWPDRREPEAYINNGVKDSVAVPAWDTHGNKVGNTPNFPSLRDKLLPALDESSTALMEDLEGRGLFDSTLLVWTGEFGRTPRINSDAGRDHYGNVFSAMLGGGGIRGGQVYGASDKHGAFPADNPVSPAAFAATLYHLLGVKSDAEIPDRLGRPVRVSDGQPVEALIG